MQEQSFRLLFKGQLSPGFERQQVMASIQALLKVDAARVESMLDGRTTILKNNISRADAERFKRIFDATGGVSVIQPLDGGMVAQPAPPRSAPPARPAAAPPSRSQPQQMITPPQNQGNSRNMPPGSRGYGIFLSIFIVVGAAIFTFGTWKTAQTVIFTRTAVTASGTVTGFTASRSSGSGSRSSTTYAPEVKFRAPNGRLIRFRSQLSSNIVSYHVDDQVPVKYDPADPHHAEIDSFMPLWGVPILILLIGSGFTAAGLRMLAVHRRAKESGLARPTPNFSNSEAITCPSCGFRQPPSSVCRACNADFAKHRKAMSKAEQFAARISGKVAAIRFAVVAISMIIGVVMFYSQWRTFSSGGSGRPVPTVWSDSQHRYEFTVPAEWQMHSTRDVVATYPVLQTDPPVMYQLLATTRTAQPTIFALGVSGIPPERVAAVGWDAVLTEITGTNKVVLSDVPECNGLTLHRVGYETSSGYREDMYFEAEKHVIMAAFALPAGANVAEEAPRIRKMVMNNLSGT